MLELQPIPVDLSSAEPPGAAAPVRRPRYRERAPILRRVSGSQHGGWPLFCRLLLWATRNARDGSGGTQGP